MIRIGLLHLSLRAGDLPHNVRLVEEAISTAGANGANWVITPELCLTGYDFAPSIGSDWIREAEADPWVRHFSALAKKQRLVLFLAHPERDSITGKLHNSLFVVGEDGALVGRHRKINALALGAEAWTTPGLEVQPVTLSAGKIGLLVCADAYTVEPSRQLCALGAELLISSANWAPKPHGPEGCWERRSIETGLPLIVCNRTGHDRAFDFTASETTIIRNGERLLNFQSERSAVIVADWDFSASELLHHEVMFL